MAKKNNEPVKEETPKKPETESKAKPKSAKKKISERLLRPLGKSSKKDKKPAKFEDNPEIKKLYLVFIIVDLSISKTVEKLMQNLGSSMQFTLNGKGTAPSEILNILGVVDNSKGVVHAVVSEDRLDDVKRELKIFFAASKKNRGIAFTVPFTSVEGIRVYKYLTQTI